MKSIKLKNLVKKIIKEQKDPNTYTVKDPGACAEKTLMPLPPSVYQALMSPWMQWIASIDQGSTDNQFIVEGELAKSVIDTYFTNANGTFSDNYFTMNPAEGSLIQSDQLEEPYCPYGYINNATIVVAINNVAAFAGTVTSFDDLMSQVQQSNLEVFIEMWSQQTQGTTQTGGYVYPSNWGEFLGMLDFVQTVSGQSAAVAYVNELTINMCNCEWSTFIIGCMDQEACNYDSEANEEGECDYTSCAGCTDENACNFDQNATITNNSECDYTSCAGCTDTQACDYDESATISTPCQDYTSCVGCMDPDALNYDPDATIQAGGASGCQYEGEIVDPPDTGRPIKDKVPDRKPRPGRPKPDDDTNITLNPGPDKPITLGGDTEDTGGSDLGDDVQYGITACNPNSAFFNCFMCCAGISLANANGANMYSEECECGTYGFDGGNLGESKNLVKRLKKLAGIKKKK